MTSTATQSEKRREYLKTWRQTKGKEYAKQYYKENKSAYRRHHLKRTYGMTLEQWDALFASQGSSCAICHTTDKPTNGWTTDHCHETGKVRGILCHHCNVMLGNAHDNTATLAAGIAYLKDHNGSQ